MPANRPIANHAVQHADNLLLAIQTLARGAVTAADEEQVLVVEWEGYILSFADDGFSVKFEYRINQFAPNVTLPLDDAAAAALADLLGQRRAFVD
jgi:hypothetical protein